MSKNPLDKQPFNSMPLIHKFETPQYHNTNQQAIIQIYKPPLNDVKCVTQKATL